MAASLERSQQCSVEVRQSNPALQGRLRRDGDTVELTTDKSSGQ
jgi:hypothetical protein